MEVALGKGKVIEPNRRTNIAKATYESTNDIPKKCVQTHVGS